MPLVILLLAALAIFLYLTLDARRDPEKRKLYYLFIGIDIWLAAVIVFVLVTAVFDLQG